MDVSAFQAETNDELTLKELYERLPESVRTLVFHLVHTHEKFTLISVAHQIQAAASVCSRLADVGGLILTFSGCAIAFALLLTWISLYWLLTRLLLVTAVLLRRVYEERSAIGKKEDPANAPEAPLSDGKPEDHADDGYVNAKSTLASSDKYRSAHASSGQGDGPVVGGITATSADLDAFEQFINSPRAQRDQTNNATHTRQPDHSSSVEASHPSGDQTEHDRIMEKLLRQEEEMEAAIQRAYRAQNEVQQSRDQTTDTEPSAAEVPKAPGEGDNSIALPAVPTTTTLSHSLTPAQAPLSRAEMKQQKKAAEQTKWLQQVNAGSNAAPHARSAQQARIISNVTQSSTLFKEARGNRPNAGSSLLGTPEQLAVSTTSQIGFCGYS